MTDRTMRVKGVGKASAAPDRVVLRFEVSAWDPEYGASIEALNGRVESLRKDLEGVDLEREQLMTSRFRVDTTYEKVSRFGREERRVNGYRAAHNIRLELSMDRELLNGVLNSVAASAAEPTVSVSFEVSDPAPLREAALKDAVVQATGNAETLAEAAGVTLEVIQAIEYGWAELRVQSVRYDMAMTAPAAQAATPDIEPQEVEASESVTMTWGLGKH